MSQQGLGADVQTLEWFAHAGLRSGDGTPKPGLAEWDFFRRIR